MHVCKHKLQQIAYCSDDGSSGNKVFSFIAKKGDGLFQCNCFETQNLVSVCLASASAIICRLIESHQQLDKHSVLHMKDIRKQKLHQSLL